MLGFAPTAVPTHRRLLVFCLTGVLACLLLVGVVSSTFLRHVIQVMPIVAVLLAISRGKRVSPYLALPIFIIWLLLMVLIWLYLLGIATFFSGSFSPVEVLLTILIGAFSAVGIMACLGAPTLSPIGHRAGAVFVFAIVQVAAMWLSFMPAFADR